MQPNSGSVSNDKLFKASAKSFLDGAMVTGRYSAGLIREFDAHVENGTANIFPIFDEIGALEGAKTARPSRTKPASLLGGKWLKRLWHKHYTQARFMVKNLERHWTDDPDRLPRLIIDSLSGREYCDEKAVRELSQGFVQGYLQRGKDGRLTGEWVVFAKQDDVNYYLTLGTHTEEKEAIWRRCKACAAEFPGLRIIQEDRG
jgi:hypothetical protein